MHPAISASCVNPVISRDRLGMLPMPWRLTCSAREFVSIALRIDSPITHPKNGPPHLVNIAMAAKMSVMRPLKGIIGDI